MKILSDIYELVLFVALLFLLAMALVGWELSERPWYQSEQTFTPHKVGDPWPDPVYRLPAESRKYLTKGVLNVRKH